MIRVLLTKLGQMALLLPILHFIGFFYARFHPSFNRPTFGVFPGFDELTYPDYVMGIFFEGDFGEVGRAPMLDVVSKPFFNSLILIVFSLLIVGVLGIILGLISVAPRRGRIRPVSFYINAAGSSLPGFLLGGIVIAIAVYLTLYGGVRSLWLPMTGCGEGTPVPFSSCSLDKHLILPLIVLAVRPTLHVAKVTAGLMENELALPYVRAARGKGGRWWRAYLRHAGSNIISPVLIVIGQSFRWIVSGLLIAETMFNWPGIGRFFVFAIVANENFSGQFRFFAHPELLATLAFLLGFIILTADLINAMANYAVDPRSRV